RGDSVRGRRAFASDRGYPGNAGPPRWGGRGGRRRESGQRPAPARQLSGIDRTSGRGHRRGARGGQAGGGAMTARWRFSDLEFVVRWQRLREDPLPHPFMFTTDIAHEDDYQRELRKVADRLRATPDPALDAALEDIARPDIAILVRGSDGFDPANPEASIRL